MAGHCYETGFGTAADPERALMCYVQAAHGGEPRAAEALKRLKAKLM